jgi:hypothetical protein
VRFELGFCKSRLLITHQAFQMGPKHAHRAPQYMFPPHDPVANPTSHTSTRAAVMLPPPSNKSRRSSGSDRISHFRHQQNSTSQVYQDADTQLPLLVTPRPRSRRLKSQRRNIAFALSLPNLLPDACACVISLKIPPNESNGMLAGKAANQARCGACPNVQWIACAPLTPGTEYCRLVRSGVHCTYRSHVDGASW